MFMLGSVLVLPFTAAIITIFSYISIAWDWFVGLF